MTDRPEHLAELRELLNALVDGTIAPEAHARLTEILESDTAARRYYLQHMSLDAALTGKHTQRKPIQLPVETKTVVAQLPPRNGFGASLAIALAATVLMAAAAVAVYMLVIAADPDPVDPDPVGPTVATLIDVAEGGTLVVNRDIGNPGDDYATGTYSIDRGSAQLQLTSGVGVVMSGRTEFVVHGDMRTTLDRGRVSFTCPAGAEGFVVSLPGGARVVDLGTAFEVDVDEAGDAAIRVTEGKVRVELAGDAEPVELTAHMAVTLADRGTRVDTITRRIQPVSYAYVGQLKPGPKPTDPQTDDRRDTDLVELTDGVVGSGDFQDHAWVGVADPTRNPNRPHPAILFDLGEPRTIRAVVVTYLVDGDAGVTAPSRASVAIGNSADALELAADDTAFDRSPDPTGQTIGSVRTHTIEFTPQPARYVRVDLFNDNEWTFIGEIGFTGVTETESIPTP